jgi:hypothetical protein
VVGRGPEPVRRAGQELQLPPAAAAPAPVAALRQPAELSPGLAAVDNLNVIIKIGEGYTEEQCFGSGSR